uniref:MBD domain-containing protein n=1 Tax=Steinernema glaseri TaxID=37863 RepID=A0A1I7Y2V8_9BILA
MDHLENPRGTAWVETRCLDTQDDGLPYWRTKELLRYMRRQADEQLEESGLRRGQMGGFECQLRNPFSYAPELPYYQSCHHGCEKGRPFVIPARFRTRHASLAQCCGRCAFWIDEKRRESRKEKKRSRIQALEVSEDEVQVELPQKRKPRIVEKPSVVIVEEPKEELKEVPKKNEKPVKVAEVDDGAKPPIYGAAELEFGLKNVLKTTRKTIKAVRDVRFFTASSDINCDLHLGALEKLEHNVKNYKEHFDVQKRELNQLLAEPKTQTSKADAGALNTSRAISALSVSTAPVKHCPTTVATTSAPESDQSHLEWGAKSEVSVERKVSESGPQFCNVRSHIRTRPRESYRSAKMTVQQGCCLGKKHSAPRDSTPVAPKRRRTSSMDVCAIRREQERLDQERLALAIEKAQWTEEKVERRMAGSAPSVRRQFRRVMQDASR